MKVIKRSLRIIYYHLVTGKASNYYLSKHSFGPRAFYNQIKYLKKKFNIISLDQAYEIVTENKEFNNNLVITFDDGFREIYDLVFPILSTENISATVYLISDCIDNKDMMWRNKLKYLENTAHPKSIERACEKLSTNYNIRNKNKNESLLKWSFQNWSMHFKEEYCNYLWDELSDISIAKFLENNVPYLNISQIQKLSKNGWIFGSHSKSHPIFCKLTEIEAKNEIDLSFSTISKIVNLRYHHFSYPFGIRMKKEIENKLGKEQNINTMVGTKNRLNNYHNTLQWERDRLESELIEGCFRFKVLPLIRSVF